MGRMTISEMVDLPIFSLFLSTAGRFHLFSPENRSDPSVRVSNAELVLLDPVGIRASGPTTAKGEGVGTPAIE